MKKYIFTSLSFLLFSFSSYAQIIPTEFYKMTYQSRDEYIDMEKHRLKYFGVYACDEGNCLWVSNLLRSTASYGPISNEMELERYPLEADSNFEVIHYSFEWNYMNTYDLLAGYADCDMFLTYSLETKKLHSSELYVKVHKNKKHDNFLMVLKGK